MRNESAVTTAPPAAPPHVERLLAFTNSVDNEEQTDDLTTTAELSSWLHDHDLTGHRTRATSADLHLARDLRDALRDSLRAHHDGRHDAAALDRLAAGLPLRLEHTSDGPGLRPVEAGTRGGLAWILVAVTQAAADDSWRRLKICAFDECQWAFYDHSKNRSSHWCSMAVCGQREKNRRAYRRRVSRARG